MALADRSGSSARPTPEYELLQRLVCPACHGRLEWATETIRCFGCGRRFAIVEGIPVFADPAAERSPGAEYKREQIEYFDGMLAEFEIERPHKTTPLYRWLMDEKQRRGLRGLQPLLPGITAITVCGGSGMDGEYLARAGARVIVSDIALSAALRARERARRYGLSMVAIVADAEQLPLADDGVGLAFVHDGLHHLNDPRVGLVEMARVASSAVSITEPARAAATRIAVRIGIALEREQAGNRVERLDPQDVTRSLDAAGFRVVGAERYAMSYQPGRVSRVLSRPRLLVALRLVFAVLNLAIGRFGNKLTVQAARREQLSKWVLHLSAVKSRGVAQRAQGRGRLPGLVR